MTDPTIDPTNEDAVDDVTRPVTTPPVPRATVSVMVAAGLVAVLLLAAAAVWFAADATQARDAARKERDAVTADLRREREHLSAAEADASTRRTAVKTAAGLFAQYSNSTGSIVALLGQETQLATEVQANGARQDITADDFNATLDRHNQLVDQYNAAVDAFSRQFAQTAPQIS